jgi:Transposase IS116/IS110/IS902 family
VCQGGQGARRKDYRNAPQIAFGSICVHKSFASPVRSMGYKVQTAQTVISEAGVDMSRWRTEKQFAYWLGLCPDQRISGGKVLKRGTRHVVNRAATALRVAAWSLFRSQSALGANFRRLRRKPGAPKAITAMAHEKRNCSKSSPDSDLLTAPASHCSLCKVCGCSATRFERCFLQVSTLKDHGMSFTRVPVSRCQAPQRSQCRRGPRSRRGSLRD